jgi:hypothetical protein
MAFLIQQCALGSAPFKQARQYFTAAFSPEHQLFFCAFPIIGIDFPL